MKIAAKPISSPGRPEKYPPPLMRFLRSNPSSKSRGRSRSSPMFIRRRNNNNNNNNNNKNSLNREEEEEPTSPKVTCIGQVRSKARTGRSRPDSGRPCSCFRVKMRRKNKPLFLCPNLGRNCNLRFFELKPNWRKWVLFFRSGYCRKSVTREDSTKKKDNKYVGGAKLPGDDDDGETEAEEANGESIEPPPRNALLLTRCRSAPYRSSSLASRFWEISVAEDDDINSGENRGMSYKQLDREEEVAGPTSDIDPISTKIEEKVGESEGIEGSIPTLDNDRVGRDSIEKEETLGDFSENGEIPESDKDRISVGSIKMDDNLGNFSKIRGSISRKSEEVARTGAQSSSSPLVLMRCKSEPAKTGERLLLAGFGG